MVKTEVNFEEVKKEFSGLKGQELVAAALKKFRGQITLLSAFNPEDVIISKWIADVAPDTPILFLDTKKHFPETLRYVDEIVKDLGLTNVKTLEPRQELVDNIDKEGELWKTQVNRCCWLRKVEPIERELKRSNYDVLFTGRRREQTPERANMEAFELDDKGDIKINPLFDLTKSQRDKLMYDLNLPHHPLYKLGYLSIGCAPCTTPIFPGEDERAGRWRHVALQSQGGKTKTECGLHVGDYGEDDDVENAKN